MGEGMSLSNEEEPLKLKVLIADDDPPTRILLRAAIIKWGYETIEAGNGKEAWDMLQEKDPPHLLIVDWLMPELDGIELCTLIRKDLNFHPYIILLTQVSGTTNIIRGLEAGADEFLSKPFKMAELRSRLSVGARIIEYQNWVKQQALNLMPLENIITNIEEISKEMDGLKENLNEIKIKELHAKLLTTQEQLKNIKLNLVKRPAL